MRPDREAAPDARHRLAPPREPGCQVGLARRPQPSSCRYSAVPSSRDQSVGDIRLGAGEDEIVTVLGVPDRLDSSYSGGSVDLKIAHYATPSPPPILWVILRAGRVEAVPVVAADLSRPVEFRGKSRGVGLGSLIADVRKAYGTLRASRLWYPAAGIAFNPAEIDPSDRDRVDAILIGRPGLDVKLVGAHGRLH